ncbi:hypothetical protein C8R45DRAFT_454104 [Mycena sanguinolenta]|nr:hypothetical protein C8R45DRAFT_454104 [Mycena sanguinolenta]
MELEAKRLELIENDFYLGVPEIREEVVWRRMGANNRVITKESTLAAEKGSRDSDQAAKSGKVTADDTEDDKDASESPLTAATLTFVASIPRDGFWLYADSRWTGPRAHAEAFEDAKLNCRVVAPSRIEVFSNDFPEVLENVRWLMSQTETAGAPKVGIFAPNHPNSLKLRHGLFEKANGNTSPEDIERMENWPINSHASKAVETLKHTHRIVPLPAYDENGKLIDPRYYEEHLLGAVVLVVVNLNHWYIKDKKDNHARDTYTADIQRLRVLVPPPITTPKQGRIIPQTDPGSPSKKRRVA